jgi:hypothetical protein
MKNFSRFLFAAFLLLLVTTQCKADEECTTPGECANPDVTADASVGETVEATADDIAEATEDATPEPAAERAAEDPNCPSREYVIRCSAEYLDTDKNGKVERAELQTAIDTLPWYARGT